IQAATDATPEETAPDLADLQASQAQVLAALEQNQQQLTQLQNQLDLFSAEQTLVGSALAQVDVARANPPADLTNVSFSLTSLDTGEAHQLQIQGKTSQLEIRHRASAPFDGTDGTAVDEEVPGDVVASAAFTAVWDPANEGGFQVTGTLSQDEAGNIH